MKFLSLSCRGLTNPYKNLAIKQLVDLHSTHILFLQETMVDGTKSISTLKLTFPSWDFLTLDVIGKSRGVVSNWDTTWIRLFLAWSFK